MTRLLKSAKNAAVKKADTAQPRRMGKKERTRQEIYRTAMQLFSERDYDSVTIEDICAGAGIAKATFFLHFAGKAALVSAFNDEITQSMAEQLAEHEGTAEEQLMLLSSVFEEAWTTNAPVMRKMLSELLDQPAGNLVTSDINANVFSLVADILRRGQERGELRSGFMPEVGAGAIVATWSAVTAWWSRHPEAVSTNFNQQFIDITLNGLKKTDKHKK